MECREVKKVVFLYTDNEMEEELLISFRRHVAMCPGCAERIHHAKIFLRVLRQRSPRVAAPERLRVRILTSLPNRR
jgi:mycothiol system anti-sigma-R factor